MFTSRPLLTVTLLLTFVVQLSVPAMRAQQPDCLPRVRLVAGTEPNIFTEEQEVEFGDIVAEQIQRNYSLIEDAELNAYLNRVGEKLYKHLPPTRLRFRFTLVDLPDANAFVLPGGRIYVARKLVALAESEDELAGVIAHELGHLVAREGTIELTRRLKEVLGVTQVTDRRDIYEKYNQLIDNFKRRPDAYKPRDREKGQMVADQIGFYALVTAGYDPSAQARLWDRAADTKGKKGNFFSDLFGSTRPEERRLREMLKVLSALPAACRVAQAQPTAEFKQWQTAVVAYSGSARTESLHGVVSRQQLNPPLRGDIDHLRFSPDGQYVLAQDDGGINVLTRQPFVTAFRIEAPDARPARFSPDSQSIVFYTDNLRVERWSLAERKLIEAKEIVVPNGCLQSRLSPDGNFLACLTPKFDLNVINVSTGQPVIQRNEFYAPDYYSYLGIFWILMARDNAGADLGINVMKMEFSPDGKYFVFGYYGPIAFKSNRYDSKVEAYDMSSLAKVSLPDEIKKYIGAGFVFTANDRIVAVNPDNNKKSGLISFPSGKPLSEFPLSRRTLIAPTRSDHLIVKPVKDYALGVMNTTDGTIFKVNSQPALDIYDDVFVAEMRSGEVGLFRMEKGAFIAAAPLSTASLGRLRVLELSPDMKWVAISGRSRGGVWNVNTGQALLHLRGFSGAHIRSDGYLFAEFPKYEEAERNVARFNLANGEIVPGPKIEATNARQIGPYVTVVKTAKQDQVLEFDSNLNVYKNVVLEVFDAATMKLLWSKSFAKEAPRVWLAPTLNTGVLLWNVKDEAARAAIKADARLAQQLAANKEKEGDYFLQVINPETGQELGKLLIETGKGSFRAANVFAAGEWIVFIDTQNRVLVYSLTSGNLIGRAFGEYSVVSQRSGLLAVENEKGKLAVYDLATMNKLDSFTFGAAIAMLRFGPDGDRLFVLTRNQTAYLLDVSGLAKTARAQ